MAVSKAIVPLLKGKATTKIVDDFKKSKFIPATTTDRENASSAIAKFLRERIGNSPALLLYWLMF